MAESSGLRIGFVVVALTVVAATATAAAAGKKSNAGTAAASGRFDLSGVWMNDNTLDERLKREGRHRLGAGENSDPPPPDRSLLTPAYQAVFDKEKARLAKLAEGAEACMWPGLPGIMTYPYPFEVLETKGRITLLFEAESQVRRIFLDRTQHLDEDDLDPSFNGDSIGHWENGVLVVDTIGFNELTKIRGLPHSDQMRIVERIRKTGANTIEDEITITDPVAFVKPIIQKVVYSRRPDWRIREYSCSENNRDAPDASGQRSGGVVK